MITPINDTDQVMVNGHTLDRRTALVNATAETLCASYQRHRPYHLKGFYACDRCRSNAYHYLYCLELGQVALTKRIEGQS